MKRCKNCVYWQFYRGNESTVPGRAKNACVARTHTYDQVIENTNTGESRTVPRTIVTNKAKLMSVNEGRPNGLVDTQPSRFFGVRTRPNHVCDHFHAKRPPVMKAEPAQPVAETVDAG